MTLARVPATTPPFFSALRATGQVGPDYFARAAAVATSQPVPQGLVDSLEDLARPGLDTRRIHPEVRAFFERTAAFELLFLPGFVGVVRPGAWLFRIFAGWLGQLCLPVMGPAIIDTKMIPLDAIRDGRPGVRGVLRICPEDGRVMHVAAYATHAIDDARCMSVALPVPGGNITGILRLDALESPADPRLGAALTSEVSPQSNIPVGTHFVTNNDVFPFPLRETLRFWGRDMAGLPFAPDDDSMPGATVVGRHDMFFLGARFATHTYYLRRRQA